MDNGAVPQIAVGILQQAAITLHLEGVYKCPQCDGGFSGELTISLFEGELLAEPQDMPSFRASSLLLEPLDGECSFVVRDVVIGIGFHWERREDQHFKGAARFIKEDELVRFINVISLEDYLVSVISSEMRGDSSPALLKAHTIISRSWLMAQVLKQDLIGQNAEEYQSILETDGEYIRWYDREDHGNFHVCADDHCQRYQGISRSLNPEVAKAVSETHGQVLVHGGEVCDARFSKCCGGVVEEFQNCWEPVVHPYLRVVDDNPADQQVNVADMRIEANAEAFIKGKPDAFCNTTDRRLLSQVLNDYDQESMDFYRWERSYSQRELAELIRSRSGQDFGQILDLQPVERGSSGRLVKLRIVGSKKSLVLGKELEIRRWLSSSHLYSSAFVVTKEALKDGVPGRFTLRGAGWGHGVGLCQIGAAVMADRGYSHREILAHYFIDAELEKRYD